MLRFKVTWKKPLSLSIDGGRSFVPGAEFDLKDSDLVKADVKRAIRLMAIKPVLNKAPSGGDKFEGDEEVYNENVEDSINDSEGLLD